MWRWGERKEDRTPSVISPAWQNRQKELPLIGKRYTRGEESLGKDNLGQLKCPWASEYRRSILRHGSQMGFGPYRHF